MNETRAAFSPARLSHNQIASIVRRALLDRDPYRDLGPWDGGIYAFARGYNGASEDEHVVLAWRAFVS
jgi:hypothetical protein